MKYLRDQTNHVVALAVGVLGSSYFLLFVNPRNKPFSVILLPIIFIWITGYSLLMLVFGLLIKKWKRTYTIVVTVLISLIVSLLLLSGVGQLSLIDVLLTSALTIIGAFYFSRSWD